jgi:hypothetical protein
VVEKWRVAVRGPSVADPAPVPACEPSVISEEAAQRLVANYDTTTATGLRDAAILMVLERLAWRHGRKSSARQSSPS